MRQDVFKAALADHGFRTQPNSGSINNECKWYAYRNIDSELQHCERNEKQPQLIIEPHYFNYDGNMHESCVFRITGERGGTLFSLTAYTVKPDDALTKLGMIEEALTAAWNAV